MHPVVVVLVALLVALALVSVVVLHRKAKSALDGHESLAADSDAMLIGSSGGASRCAASTQLLLRSGRRKRMNLARSVFLESEIGAIEELPRTGSALENPFVFDAVANDLKRMVATGLVEVVEERRNGAGSDTLIESFRYRRLRAG